MNVVTLLMRQGIFFGHFSICLICSNIFEEKKQHLTYTFFHECDCDNYDIFLIDTATYLF